ncbi:MAG: hypothetical protein HQL56_01385 [Magnetococcales bacterium]|nr:hypothetical protein [Magnetococcales bacterium]
MKAVKILVIAMGILLVAGLVGLLFMANRKWQQASSPVEVTTIAQPVLKSGEKVSAMASVEGGLALLLEERSGGQGLLILDGRGRLLRRVALSAPAAQEGALP